MDAQIPAVDTIYAYFKQYPKIYSGAYFRFLKAAIAEHLSNGTYLHRDGAYLGWKVYKRKGDHYDVGTVLLDKLVNSKPGTGIGKALLDEFLERFGDRHIVLKRLEGNEIAKRLYLSRGFVEEGKPKNGFVRMARYPTKQVPNKSI